VQALGNLQETGAPVPICSARRWRELDQIRQILSNRASEIREETKQPSKWKSARNETIRADRKRITMIR
jgi:hypothetical protein